ncbi:FprA family A-type flavoprotein [Subdoligranulum variabile]|uniref:Metallo-beta-lactamase domain protein n=1 Tax=Subdoligranulum variabile DSM 15176 TaxID=411471 RepID=D1PN86_9FIRM|nr:FprA family A-type flavoprotein [Subdoligranulum variabile]EFB76021.1 metallo-beta-lactamase domain protein [Subdoligranulum variabile DSM 15176]UWP68674.1 FprA family A-type flavoprotein [Subdoligranulum variabile]
MEITKDILYVGVNDHDVDLFEGQYKVPNGMAYNSYLIQDEKVAVMDSVDAHFTDAWLTNIAGILGGRTPDYLVVQHMEPDHSGSVYAFSQAYPDAKIVASAKAVAIMQQFFDIDFTSRSIIVKEGDTLELGKHTLHFVTAPMVHWPEVIMTYDAADKVLFSADAFGKFGALDVEEEWLPEARRYYIGIVGKYGQQVQGVLKKAAGLEIETVCSLHGPVLHKEQLGDVLAAYDTWSAYRPETEGVLVAYSSIYGHTKQAAEELGEKLRAKGVDVMVMDLARCDMSEAVAQAFRYSKLVLASPTYNGEVFPFTRSFIEHLTERNYQNRTVAIIENGTWAPTAGRVMRKMLENSKNLTILDETVSIKSALNETSRAQLDALVEALSK